MKVAENVDVAPGGGVREMRDSAEAAYKTGAHRLASPQHVGQERISEVFPCPWRVLSQNVWISANGSGQGSHILRW